MATSRSCFMSVREIHGCHAAGAELAVEAVAVGESGG